MITSVCLQRTNMSEKSPDKPKSEDKSTSSGEKTEYVQPYMAKKNDDLGYYFFPSRNPDKVVSEESRASFKNIVKNIRLRGSTEVDHARCLQNVLNCAQRDPKTQMMLRALQAHGCPVNVKRHFSCEPCRMKMSGGYDFYNSQVIVCQNSIKTEAPTCNVLSHELLHAFDHCRAKFDPKNIEHLACTEIRAANIFHCRLGPSFIYGEIHPFNLKDRHQHCVRHKAALSVSIARNISSEEANEVIEKVFEKCYSDLEPYGRRPRKHMGDFSRALQEGLLYGYL